MKKLFILIILLVAIIALVVVNYNNPTTLVTESNTQETLSSPMEQAIVQAEIALNTQALGSGEYIYYYKDSFKEDIKYNKVVLFFYASWCPTCAVLQEELISNKDKIPDGVRIIRVPYDDVSGANQENLAMNAKYKVTYQHTLVQIDGNGELITKWNGSYSLDEILNKIQ